MPVQWIVLGTAPAIPAPHEANTFFACADGDHIVLVDCPGGALRDLMRLGLPPQQITDLVLTHFHPDHISGVPLLLMDLWLMGRTVPLRIHGLSPTLDRLETLMDLFGWSSWPDFYPVAFHRLPAVERTPLLETPHTRWWASPVCHLVPAIGLRMDLKGSGKSVVYSGDTEPCPTVERLAQGATVLFHEATGEVAGHTPPVEAAALALRARVERLYLVHLPLERRERALEQAQRLLGPRVALAYQGLSLTFP